MQCRCVCGARYRVRDEAVGKQVKCPKCGSLFAVKPIDPEAELELSPIAEETEGTQRISRVQEEQELLRASMRKAPRGMKAPPKVVIVRGSGFWGDALRSFAVLFSLEGIFILVFLSVLNFVSTFAGCLSFVLYGYVAAYYMNCVSHAAAGEPGIPHLSFDNITEDIIIPMFQWIGCQLFVMAPAIVWFIVYPNLTVDEDAAIAVLCVLAGLGAIFWPIFLLSVCMGGLTMLFRCDKCVRAVLSSPGPYLLICILLLLAIGPLWGLKVFVLLHTPGEVQEVTRLGQWGIATLIAVLDVYAMIVCCRLIGLYYHHFKKDFPWAMG